MECIKCGKPVAAGELFCQQCSLNLAELMEEQPQTARYPKPEGKMQTPRPSEPKKVPVKATPAKPAAKPSGNFKGAFAAVCLLLVLAVGFILWQYTSVQLEKNRLRVREDALNALEWEVADLKDENSRLTAEIEAAQQTIAAKELALQEVEQALTGSESTMSQTQYDMANQKLELERTKSEKTALEAELVSIQTRLEAAEKRAEESRTWQEKAQFMDDHVVFVEDDRSGFFHTYNCPNFAKQKFWAYSRKLAENQGYTPCTTCGGRP